jgi:hypothetical protein
MKTRSFVPALPLVLLPIRSPILSLALITLATSLSLPALVFAQFAAPGSDQPAASGQFYLPAPDIPVSAPGEGIEPEVTITETEAEVITEYRIRGRLYMVKIDPLTGPAYYLFDSNGDGTLDTEEGRGPNLSVPQWLLFSW